MTQLDKGSSAGSGMVEGWTERTLGDIAIVTMGQSPPSSAYNSDAVGLPLIQGNADIKNRRTIVRSWTSKWSKECRQGDIVMTVRAPVGSLAIAHSDVCLGRGVCALSPRIESAFLYHALAYREIEWTRLAQGSTFTAANGAQVRGFSILVPDSPKEQLRIAEVLTDTDELIEGLERIISKKRDLAQGVRQQLLSGAAKLPGFSDNWKLQRLADVGVGIRGVGYDPDRDLLSSDDASSTRLLRANNISDGDLNNDSLQRVRSVIVRPDQFLREGDVVICGANGSKSLVGKAARFAGDAEYRYTFGAFMNCFRTEPKHACPAFIAQLLKSTLYRRQVDLALAGSSINNLSVRQVVEFTFPLPPISEQKAIAEVLSDVDAEIEALEKRLTKTRDLKQGMAQELLTGRTRLV